MKSKVLLSELVEINYGKAFKAEDRPTDGIFPIYGSNGVVGKSYEALVEYPTIVIGRKGAVGEVHLAENGCWPIDTAFYTSSLSIHEFSLRYLYLYLKSLNLKTLAITSTIPGINRTTLYRQEIPLPPLAEQERIVCVLDEAEALRKLRSQASERMDEFVPALFHEMFGDVEINDKEWKTKSLGELLLKIESGWSPVCLDRPVEQDEWGMLKLGALTSCEYDDTQNKAFPKESHTTS